MDNAAARLRTLMIQAFPFLTVIVLWEGLTRGGLIRPLILPPLSIVLQRLWAITADGSLLINFALTIGRMLMGFSLAMVGGIVLGLVLALSRPLRTFFEPLIAAVYPLPKIAMLSLFIVWLGFGTRPIVVILAISAFSPIFISTMTGILTVDNLLIQAARNLGANRYQLLARVVLPGALPVIFGGLRIASSMSLIVVVAVEMYIGDAGMGYLLRRATDFYQMDLMYASIVAIGLFGILLFNLIGRVERWLMPWHRHSPLIR